jgi:hypothetical protein
VAVSHLGFPRLGDAIVSEPVRARIGTITIGPGEENARADWRASWDGRQSWDDGVAARIKKELKTQGYSHAGWHETVRPDDVAPERDLPRLIQTTDTFRTASRDLPGGFPDRWRMAQVYYSPVDATCGLLVFHDRARRDFFQYRLIRIDNPGIRSDRALAHVTNGLLLLERGDRGGALAEAAIAAEMAPDYSPARYQFGAMLAINGKSRQALDELEAALKLDGAYKKKARSDVNYEDLRWMPRFKELVR